MYRLTKLNHSSLYLGFLSLNIQLIHTVSIFNQMGDCAAFG